MSRWFNQIVLSVALLVGVVGGWSLRDGAGQYVSTSRAFANVTVEYQQGSFAWLAPDGRRAHLSFVVTNGSARAATLESLDIHLLFGEDFAGTNYDPFVPVAVPAGESRLVDLEILVTSLSKLPLAGTSELAVRGNATFRFAGIQRARGLDVRGEIGVVPLPSGFGGGR